MTGRPGPDRFQDEVTAGPGGAMTYEAGVITGRLVVATALAADGRAAVTVRRAGTDRWYTVAGSPFPVPPDGLAMLHATVVAAIGAR